MSRRERKKQQTRQALIAAAFERFTEHGYDATTVEDICEDADVSVRTFFRYFDSKEAVLYGDWRPGTDTVLGLVADSPPEESPLEATRRALLVAAAGMDAQRDAMLAVKRLASLSRSAGDYEENVIHRYIEAGLTRVLAVKLDVDTSTDLRPELWAGVATAIFKAAKHGWVRCDGRRTMTELTEEAYRLVLAE